MSFVDALLNEMDSLVTGYAEPTVFIVSVTLGLPFVLVIRRYTATERTGKSTREPLPFAVRTSLRFPLRSRQNFSAVAYGSTEAIVRTLLLFPGSPKYPPGDTGK
jgi:hypothetical protein